MERLHDGLSVGGGAGAGAGGAAGADDDDDDELSESDGDELPELGQLPVLIGDMRGSSCILDAAFSSSLSDNAGSLLTTSGETEFLRFDIRLSRPGLGMWGLRSSLRGFSCTLLVKGLKMNLLSSSFRGVAANTERGVGRDFISFNILSMGG